MSTNPAPTGGLVLGNKIYDRAKFLVQVFLPALGVLYASIAVIFGLGGIEQVLGVLAAIGLFIGTIMRVSANNFTPAEAQADGAFLVTTLPNGKTNVELEFEQDPATLIDGRVLTFKIKDVPLPEPEEEIRDENSP